MPLELRGESIDTAPMLELIDVAKRYGAAQALAPTSLAIPVGATVVLLGPSGCGKSTLLRLIAGIVAPDQGEIRFEGEPVAAANLNRLRARMGYVIQEGGLFPHMTARANVTLMARHLGWARDRIEARLQQLTDLVHLPAALLARYPIELSGGQRQRVSLMRALMLDPRLLLLDEPLGALDTIIRFELQQELKSIFERLAKTVLLVTHDLAEAAYFGNLIVLMRDGRVVQRGSLRELVHHPVEPFVTQFVTAQRAPFERLQQVTQ